MLYGANPTIVSYNASAEKMCTAASNLVRFENNFLSILTNALAYFNAGVVVVVNSEAHS
jgi:hypothetical protein